MQLPLSVSALVMLGVAAVLVGASILVVVAVRRRKPANASHRIPPDMRVPQQPAATSGAHAAAAPADNPAGPVTAEPTPSAAQTLVGPVAAAATPRPPEVVARVEPPVGGEQIHVDPTPSGEMSAVPPRHHQAGSGRTVAAAVAQAFAVRAAAGRTGSSGPGEPPPVDPPPSDDVAARESAEPERDDVPGVADVDPAATTAPDGLGLAALAASAPDVSGNGGTPAAAHGQNGDRPADGSEHGPAGNGWQASEPAAPEPGAGLPAGGWAVPAQAEPEQAVVPAPRSDDDPGRGGSAADARDRLLAVLLEDPERAVGAAVELEACLRELDRLSDAVRTGRAALRDVLHRLAAAGLRPDQLARLARLPQAEVQELLTDTPAEQQA